MESFECLMIVQDSIALSAKRLKTLIALCVFEMAQFKIGARLHGESDIPEENSVG